LIPNTPFDFLSPNIIKIASMILGKEIKQIQAHDYLHRFVLLQKVVKLYGQRFENQDAPGEELSKDYYQYEKLLN
jgi:hypothetical protein